MRHRVSDHQPDPSGERRHDARWVSAPADSDPSVGNRVLGVWLAPKERVCWSWAMLPDGRQYVCGYVIEQAWRASARRRRRRPGFRVDGAEE
jgi:hypothetical protein